MSIFNRSKDVSEQRERFNCSFVGIGTGFSNIIATGVTLPGFVVPYPCTIDCAQIAAIGVSGSPQFTLAVNRFIAGTGFTTWVLTTGASNIPAAYGTSGAGAFGASVFGSSGMLLTNASGSTLNNLMANDLLTITTGGSNSAVTSFSLSVVLKPIQDVKINYNLV